METVKQNFAALILILIIALAVSLLLIAPSIPKTFPKLPELPSGSSSVPVGEVQPGPPEEPNLPPDTSGGSTGQDFNPPSISIINPFEGAIVSGIVLIEAQASDESGISRLEFWLDGLILGNDSVLPYSFSWNTINASNGEHSILVKAFDSFNNSSTQSINVTASNVPDTINPSVAIASPLDDANVSGTIQISVSASDNVGIQRIDLFVDGVMIYSSGVVPIQYYWNTASFSNGLHELTATAFDAANNSGSKTITVNVANSGNDASIPAITINSPTSNPTHSTNKSTITLSGSAFDDVGIEKVFWVNDQGIGGNAVGTTSWSISAIPLVEGDNVIIVIAKDSANNIATDKITVTRDSGV